LIPEACTFAEYTETDANVVTIETVAESENNIVHNLQTVREGVHEKYNDEATEIAKALLTL